MPPKKRAAGARRLQDLRGVKDEHRDEEGEEHSSKDGGLSDAHNTAFAFPLDEESEQVIIKEEIKFSSEEQDEEEAQEEGGQEEEENVRRREVPISGVPSREEIGTAATDVGFDLAFLLRPVEQISPYSSETFSGRSWPAAATSLRRLTSYLRASVSPVSSPESFTASTPSRGLLSEAARQTLDIAERHSAVSAQGGSGATSLTNPYLTGAFARFNGGAQRQQQQQQQRQRQQQQQQRQQQGQQQPQQQTASVQRAIPKLEFARTLLETDTCCAPELAAAALSQVHAGGMHSQLHYGGSSTHARSAGIEPEVLGQNDVSDAMQSRYMMGHDHAHASGRALSSMTRLRRLPARHMHWFGRDPVREPIEVVHCSACRKPVLISAMARHYSRCPNRIAARAPVADRIFLEDMLQNRASVARATAKPDLAPSPLLSARAKVLLEKNLSGLTDALVRLLEKALLEPEQPFHRLDQEEFATIHDDALLFLRGSWEDDVARALGLAAVESARDSITRNETRKRRSRDEQSFIEEIENCAAMQSALIQQCVSLCDGWATHDEASVMLARTQLCAAGRELAAFQKSQLAIQLGVILDRSGARLWPGNGTATQQGDCSGSGSDSDFYAAIATAAGTLASTACMLFADHPMLSDPGPVNKNIPAPGVPLEQSASHGAAASSALAADGSTDPSDRPLKRARVEAQS